MLGPSLRSMRKKTVRSPSPPLIQGRLTHNRPWFRVSVMNLLYFKHPHM